MSIDGKLVDLLVHSLMQSASMFISCQVEELKVARGQVLMVVLCCLLCAWPPLLP